MGISATRSRVHFKIHYDQTWDYPDICKKFFMEEHPYLCVIEHRNHPSTHVHFQGTSLMAERTVKNKLTNLAKKHHLRKLNPKCKPTSMKARPPTVLGFQYMCKEVKKEHILAINKFTMEKIMEMKEKSDLHVKALKFDTKNFITEILDKKFQDPKFSMRCPEMVHKALSRLVSGKLYAQLHFKPPTAG